MQTITWRDAQGYINQDEYDTRDAMLSRLNNLDEIERTTREFAPTDSGDVRRNYCTEAAALRQAIYGN